MVGCFIRILTKNCFVFYLTFAKIICIITDYLMVGECVCSYENTVYIKLLLWNVLLKVSTMRINTGYILYKKAPSGAQNKQMESDEC